MHPQKIFKMKYLKIKLKDQLKKFAPDFGIFIFRRHLCKLQTKTLLLFSCKGLWKIMIKLWMFLEK